MGEAAKKNVKVLKKNPTSISNNSFWKWRSIRLQMVFLLSFAMMIHGLFRAHLGMALVCMNRNNVSNESLHESEEDTFQVNWSMKEIGALHSFYYIGSVLTVFGSHHLTQKFGSKSMITYGIGLNVICVALTPIVVYVAPYYWLTGMVRLFMGLGQGLFVPCASLLVAKWFTSNEKSTAMAIFTTGSQVGIAIAMFATAAICKIPWLTGWPLSFFGFALLGCIFLSLWIPLASNRPRESHRITTEELNHIQGHLVKNRAASIIMPTPYRKIFTSPIVAAICLSSFCQSFVMVFMLSYLPEFYRSALNLELSKNGRWSAFPFAIQAVSKIVFASFADYLKQKHVSPTLVTKFSNSIASFGCATCLALVSFTENGLIVLFLLSMGLALTSAYVPGYNTSIVSIAPNFTAFISAYAQGYAQIASVLAPLTISLMTVESAVDWNGIFRMIAILLFLTGVVFHIFGTTHVQPWASITPSPSIVIVEPIQVNRSLLAVNNMELSASMDSIRPKRSPRVSFMDENGEIFKFNPHELLEPFDE